MRIIGAVLLFSSLSLISCYGVNDGDRDASRRAGREAYRASKDLKRGAREAEHQLRTAGKEFRDGWAEESRRDRAEHPARNDR